VLFFCFIEQLIAIHGLRPLTIVMNRTCRIHPPSGDGDRVRRQDEWYVQGSFLSIEANNSVSHLTLVVFAQNKHIRLSISVPLLISFFCENNLTNFYKKSACDCREETRF
jgi:hypothetical protein